MKVRLRVLIAKDVCPVVENVTNAGYGEAPEMGPSYLITFADRVKTVMVHDTSNVPKDGNGLIRFAGLLIGAVCSAALAYGVYWVTTLDKMWQFVLAGASIGLLFGLGYKELAVLWRRSRSDEWRVTEVEVTTLGQKVKLANSGSQRRVAWALFVDTTTRIATQPLSDEEGDGGIILKSLYDLFQVSRKSIMEMEPTRVLPSRRKNLETVETYILEMLNQNIRPFLSKWHPVWDAWQKSNPGTPSSGWSQHKEFRKELKALQPEIRGRAIGLGEIAGIPRVGQLMNIPASSADDKRVQ